MSYNQIFEYEIIPTQSFRVRHNCGGCGRKQSFINTGCFRVNANGNKLDVWLIYQCEKCKHTLNIPIHERLGKDKVDSEKYARFLSNDSVLAAEYGVNAELFRKYEVEETGISFEIVAMRQSEKEIMGAGDVIMLHNPYALKYRPEKVISQLWGLSRSTVKKLLENGSLVAEKKGTDLEIRIGASIIGGNINGLQQKNI